MWPRRHRCDGQRHGERTAAGFVPIAIVTGARARRLIAPLSRILTVTEA